MTGQAPKLPWQGESHENIKARFPAALVPDVDVLKCQQDLGLAPGFHRKHVFDFEAYKIRMIASTDTDGKLRGLHLSFSAWPDTLIPDPQTFTKLVNEIIVDLIGKRKLLDTVPTPRAIHFFFEP